MLSKLCSNSLTFLIFFALSGCSAQDPVVLDPDLAASASNITEILRKPEAYQRKFVADFLTFLPTSSTCHMAGYPPTSDNCDDFKFLMKYQPWVLPMTQQKIEEWQKDPDANKQALKRIKTLIAYLGSIEALEFLAKAFAETPDSRKVIQEAIESRYGSRKPNFITKYYYALESDNPQIKEVAVEIVPSMLKDLTFVDLAIWGEALVERYHHEPTTLEILKDPLVQIGAVHSGIHPEELRKTLASRAQEAYARKQSGSKRPR